MENKNIVWGTVALALIIGFFGGWWYGKQATMRTADQKAAELQKALDVFVPPLPDVVSVIGGKITAINGNEFLLEIPSLTDRYPKPGVAMRTETKTIRIAKDAKVTSTNFDPKNFKNGMPQTKTIAAGDLKTGDAVSVTVKENARTEHTLTAISINRSSGI